MLASSRNPRAAANTRGRDKSRPYEQILCFGPTGTATVARAGVGRGALTPPDRAAAQRPRADMESAPTNGGKARGYPGKRGPGNAANPCRGRFHIGPVCGGAGFRGRDLRPKSRRCAAVGLRNAPAGAVNPASTNKFYVLGQPGHPRPPGRA